jgi:23S rRNA (guanine2445-N2)-methyltransferase / 23S rRNA (guanine2069-N7)-methyltransferase
MASAAPGIKAYVVAGPQSCVEAHPLDRAVRTAALLCSLQRRAALSSCAAMSMPALPQFDSLQFVATVARGHESLLQRELADIGVPESAPVPGGVAFGGDIALGMRVCLWSRLANRVTIRLGEDRLRNERQLYASVRRLPLLDWFHPDFPIVVHSQCRGVVVTNSMFASMVAKDAICDAVRDKYGRRPDVSRDNASISFDVQVIDDRVMYGISMQGEPLHKRGYRIRDVEAPLRETLAAGLLRYAAWDGHEPLHDPMCGSGTLIFEAAMIAADMAPGSLRGFGFEKWPHFPALREAWMLLREEAEQRRARRVRPSLLGTDSDPIAMAACRVNVKALGLEGIAFGQADARELKPMLVPGLFILNPPYGERLGRDLEHARQLATVVGGALRKCTDHRVAMMAPREILDSTGLPWDRRSRVANGRIECSMAVTPKLKGIGGRGDSPRSVTQG